MCPRVDEDAAPNDIRVELASGTLLTVSIESSQALAVTDGGELIASADDWYCWSTPANVCRMTLKRLRLRLRAIEFATSAGNTVKLEGLTLAIATPLILEDSGWGYEIPPGTRVVSSLNVDGQSDCGEAVTSKSANLRIDVFQQVVSVDGTLPLTFHLTNNNCQQLNGQVSGMVSGVNPWAQAPYPVRSR